MVLRTVACKTNGLGSSTRKPADVKAVRRATAKGCRCGDEEVEGEAWREEVCDGVRREWRPVRDRWKGGGCGGNKDGWLFGVVAVGCEDADDADGVGEDDGVSALG